MPKALPKTSQRVSKHSSPSKGGTRHARSGKLLPKARQSWQAYFVIAGGLIILGIVLTLAHASSTVLASESFTSSAANFSTIKGGTWAVSNGRYVLSNPAQPVNAGVGNANYAIHKVKVTGDFILDADVMATASSSKYDDASVIFNWQDASNYLYASFNETADSGTNGIYKIVGGQQTLLQAFPTTFSAGVSRHVKVTHLASSYAVLVDGAAIGTVVDTTFSSGQFGLGSRNNADSFDNFVISLPPDTTAPSAPANLHQTTATTSSVTIAWNPSSDNIGVTGYRVYVGGIQRATAATASLTLSSLSAGTSYSVAVSALDAAGNVSAKSVTVTAKTSTLNPKPSASNTGVPTGQALTVPVTNTGKGIIVAANGNVTITKGGTFTNMRIKGRLEIKATGVTIRYSRIEASPTPFDAPSDPATTAQCLAAGNHDQNAVTAYGYSGLLIEDSQIVAVRKSIYTANAIHGSQYTLSRVDISGTVDGAGVFDTGATNVLIENSYIHDLYKGQWSYSHGCTESTHSDGIQVHYGSGIIIRDNTIRANAIGWSGVNDAGSNSGIMVNQTANYYTSHLSIVHNWIDNGACSVNVADGGKSPTIRYFTLSNNLFGTHQTFAGCAMIVTNATKADSTNVFTGNIWENGSTPLPAVRNGG